MSELVKFHDNATKFMRRRGIIGIFEVLKDINFKPDYTFVCCLFRLDSPYNKDINYTHGLYRIIHDFPKIFRKFSLRIYIDDSILLKDTTWVPIYNELFLHDFISVVRYDFPQFKMPGTFYHNGVFGMIVRIFPIFNFSNVQEITINIDIDSDPVKYEMYKNLLFDSIKNITKSKFGFILLTYKISTVLNNLGYKLISTNILKNDKFIRFCMYTVLCKKKIDKNILVDFLLCLAKKCDIYDKWLKSLKKYIECDNIHDSRMQGVCKQLNKHNNSNFNILYYGIEEFFLTYIANVLYNTNKTFGIMFSFPCIFDYHFYMYDYLYKSKKIKIEYLENFYKFVIDKRYIPNNIDRNFRIVDELYEKNEKGIYIKFMNNTYIKRIYIFIRSSVLNGYLYSSLKNDDTKNFSIAYFNLLKKFPYETFFDTRRRLLDSRDII